MAKMNLKNIIIILSSIIFVMFILGKIKTASSQCLGIPFITEEELQQIAYTPVELENIVYLDNQLTPYDEVARKIYIPCNVTETTKFYDMKGQLTSSLPEYKLYFLWEGAFNILRDAVNYGCNFTLYAIDPQGNYTSYFVIFTTLPVIEMRGEVVRIDEKEREVYAGEITVWEPAYQGTDNRKVHTSNLEWNIRGHSSKGFIKKSYKLRLKEKDGKNNSLGLLGFEADDDYILNPMWFDDIKIREKLAMELWNEIAESKGSTLKMSGGEYCEFLMNGEYQGLRLLQNKIEDDYLRIGANDILLKGNNVNKGTKKPPEEVYEVIYSNYDDETTYGMIRDFFYTTDFTTVDLESWVDMQLFLQLGNMMDNNTYKNMYYVIQDDQGEKKMRFIPWDTDMSFGIYWNDGFRYSPDSVEMINYRLEYKALKEQYPELDLMLSKRWKELRTTFFTEENIISKADEYATKVYVSGGLQRDYNYLGWNSWGDDDTIDGFKIYIQRRLQVLDEHYQ